jgi:hypothetical protein
LNTKLSHHRDNGNVLNRTSMDIDLFNTNLLDEIYIYVLLIETKSFGGIWTSGEDSMTYTWLAGRMGTGME